MFVFAIKGFSGVILVYSSIDIVLHDTYFVVVHSHYFLYIEVVFAITAGFVHLFTEISVNEKCLKYQIIITFIDVNITFFP